MKLPITKVIGAAALGLLMMLSVATDTMGQRRNRRVFRNSDKKCDKFVNCHDARDGRWDGRGPRRDRDRDRDGLFGRIFGRSRRDRDDDRFERRRRRDRDNDRFERRRWRRNRDFDRGRF